jgi:hypothetical protein
MYTLMYAKPSTNKKPLIESVVSRSKPHPLSTTCHAAVPRLWDEGGSAFNKRRITLALNLLVHDFDLLVEHGTI